MLSTVRDPTILSSSLATWSTNKRNSSRGIRKWAELKAEVDPPRSIDDRWLKFGVRQWARGLSPERYVCPCARPSYAECCRPTRDDPTGTMPAI